MLRIDGFVPDKTLLLDLLAAVFLGVLGALAVFGFHSALHAARHLLYGQTVGLVGAARSLLWWQRLLVPAFGGCLAGLVLQWSRRLKASRTAQDYMAVVARGDGFISLPFSVLTALSSLCSVVSGASIALVSAAVVVRTGSGSVQIGSV